MRGIFAAGVLDVFHERGVAPFDIAIGTSAGACNLASHVAGQHGRNRRCYLTQMRRSEFVDVRRFLRGGHWLDLDYLWDAFDREDPLDIPRVVASPTQFVVAATSVETGDATYIEPRAHDMNEALRASSAVPLMYRRFVELDGRHFTDGGVTAPIPVEEAYRRGARRIVVIRTRPARFAGPSRLECSLAATMLRSYPALARAFRRYREVYARSQAFALDPPPGCTIVHIAPEQQRATRTTIDLSALEADYTRGRLSGERALAALERW